MAVIPAASAFGAESETASMETSLEVVLESESEEETTTETVLETERVDETVRGDMEIETVQTEIESQETELQEMEETVDITIDIDNAMLTGNITEETNDTSETEDDTENGYCGDNVTYVLNKSTGVLVISGEGDMRNYSSDNNSPFRDNKSIRSINSPRC